MPLRLARRVRLLDRAAAPLQVAVANGAVEVEDAVLDVLEDLKVERALVDLLDDRNPRRRQERCDVAEWIQQAVDAVPDAVPNGEGLQRGKHQVGPGTETIDAEGLAGIGVALLDVELRPCDVEEADHPDRRVHAETSELTARPAKTPLQEAVHQALRHSEVVESAIESTLADVWKDLAPTGRDGLYQVAIEDVVVEREHLLVEPLPRVVVIGGLLLRVGDRRL